MDLLDRIFGKKFFIKKVDRNTGLITYYKCTVYKGNVTVERLDARQNDSKFELLDSNTLDSLKNAIMKSRIEYENQGRNYEGFFEMSTLYKLSDIENNDRVKNAYENCMRLKNEVLMKCKEFGIMLKTSEQDIMDGFLNQIDEDCKRETRSRGYEFSADVDFCRNKQSIEKALEEQINGDYKFERFDSASRELAFYFSSYIEHLPNLLEILKKNELTENEKLFLKRYAELLQILPSFMYTIENLDLCSRKIQKAKREKFMNEVTPEFMNRLKILVSKVNIDKESIYMQATTSKETCDKIIEKGLYVFTDDDLTDFSWPCGDIKNDEDLKRILSFEYNGNMFGSRADNYIVLYRKNKDTNMDFVEISEEEKEEALSFIEMRRNRMGLFLKPTKKISTDNILGYIDKKRKQVVLNPKYKELELEGEQEQDSKDI